MTSEANEPSGPGDQPDPRPSLLIADDDVFMRTALSAQLRDAFRIVAVAADATEAIALAEEHQPDAALLDVDMPNGGAQRGGPADRRALSGDLHRHPLRRRDAARSSWSSSARARSPTCARASPAPS